MVKTQRKKQQRDKKKKKEHCRLEIYSKEKVKDKKDK